MPPTVTFQEAERDVLSIEAFGELLDEVDGVEHFELWVSVPSGQAICMLRNRENAWLMFLPSPGDAGCTTIGDPSRTDSVAYTLGNGQVDEYPGAWCVPVEDCYKGLAYFFVNDGEQPKWLNWSQAGDGVDGAV